MPVTVAVGAGEIGTNHRGARELQSTVAKNGDRYFVILASDEVGIPPRKDVELHVEW
jgi:hypothetical protein